MFTTSHALVVGIDRYNAGIASLTTAVADARKISEILEKRQGYQVECLLDAAASGAALRAALQGLQARAADDRVLIYFAGHGVALDGEDGPAGYLVPQDAGTTRETLLPMAEVAALIKAVPCRHVLLILDCCFAGAFRWASMRSFLPKAQVLYPSRYRRFVEDRAAQVLTSAAHDQRALDVLAGLTIGDRPAVGGHSPFAAALMRGLEGDADRPGPGGRPDGVITASELYLYVRDVVEGATEHGTLQTPGLWPLPSHGRGEFVFRTERAVDLPEDPRLEPANNPWRGLEAYEARHAAEFFGREAVVEALVQRLKSPEITLVSAIGASGVGKSSVARAGVVPQLEKQGWTLLGPVRPGSEPLAVLAEQVALARAGTGPRLLVIDQLEEIFTACRAPIQRAATIELLAEVAEIKGDFKVLVTLRADFEAAFLPTLLGGALQRGRFAVPPMTREALRDVVQSPAEARALYFDPPELVERLVDDVVLLPGGLPLLSFALSELYLRAVARGQEDRALTAADYEDIGQVTGCLRRRAESFYQAADPAGQQAIRRILLRMISLEGGGVARRRVSLRELRALDPAEDTQIEARLAELTGARLLVGSGEGAPTYEPAHEALVLGWDRLVTWLDTEAAVLPLQRAIWRAASEWDAAGRPRGRLWNDDPRLPQALALPPSHKNPLENEYLRASEAWRLKRRRRTRALVGAVLGISVAAAVVGFVLASWARREEAEATRQRNAAVEAQAEAEVAEKKATSALGQARIQTLVATAAGSRDPAFTALLLSELRGLPHPEGAYEAALRLDEREVPLALLTTLDQPVAGVAFSGNGRRVVAWAPPRAVVIEIETGIEMGTLDWPGLDAARLSDDGTTLHAVSDTGKIESFQAVGMHRSERTALPAPDPVAELTADITGTPDDLQWGWPAYDPRHTLGVGPPRAVSDARLGYAGMGWFEPRWQATTTDGYWQAQATYDGDVTLVRFDHQGTEASRVAWPAARLTAACGLCEDSESQVVGVAADEQTLALAWGGDFNAEGACNEARLCVLNRAGERLTLDARRSGSLGPAWLGDPHPGTVALAVEGDQVLGCAWSHPHGGATWGDLSGEGRIVADRQGVRRVVDPGRCRLVGGGLRGPRAQAVVASDGSLALEGNPPHRRIQAASFIAAVDVFQTWVVTGHADGTVYLWPRLARPPIGIGWRPSRLDQEAPADRWLAPEAGVRTDLDERRRVGTWRWVEGEIRLGMDPPTALPIDGATAAQITGIIRVSPNGRRAWAELGQRALAVWSLAAPGPPLFVPTLRCAHTADEIAEEAVSFDPRRPALIKRCAAGPQEAVADWDTVLERVAGSVRGCLTATQRATWLGESQDEAVRAARACAEVARPLPDPGVAPPKMPEIPTVFSMDPDFPPIAEAPPSPEGAREAQRLNDAGMRALGQGNRNAAAGLFEQAVRSDPSHHLARYNLACMWSLLGRHAEALAILRAFKEAACPPCQARVERARTDEDWAALWDDPRFVEIVEAVAR